MHNYTTVTDTLNALKEESYTLDFNLKPDCLECNSPDIKLYPDDSSIIYAISSKDGLKGTLMDAYGVYADSLTTSMIDKLKIRR